MYFLVGALGRVLLHKGNQQFLSQFRGDRVRRLPFLPVRRNKKDTAK